ncbi:MAG TPA: hypothetical protein VKZ63_10230, partial [Kofleriaceae bacterium]|nr:hypothetical protein [Kofleriaceae bacterium]
ARVRCATRVSLALTGRSPSEELLAAADPQSMARALMATPEFADYFARFVNASFNPEPGMSPAEDASYYLARKIIEEGRPWAELFNGPYRVRPVDIDGKASAEVIDDPDGLGYFRSPVWMRRYAGNEEDGYRLTAAYRILQNTVGLSVDGVDNVPDADLSATGRMAPACRGCHYDSWFALDKVAKILSRRQGEGDQMTFIPPDEGPQEILGGITIGNDAELVNALVESDDFRFRVCRMSFQFLYGRDETTCEGTLFDACMAAFAESGEIQSALEVIVTDPGFCE